MNLNLGNDNIIPMIKKEIEKVYLEHPNTPFIIAYSGGKDSTITLQLFIEVLIKLKQKGITGADVYVISVDTLVENPIVIAKTKRSMENINNFATSNKIPLRVELILPNPKDSFFTNLIGRGYPAPLKSFRWCTDRIKINPSKAFINNMIDKSGEIITVLGTREDESITRKKSMEKHKIVGNELSVNTSFPSAWTYTPIAKLDVEELWNYLLDNESPWGDSNAELYKLYSDSSGECPLIIDDNLKKTSTCANSRFGCWTCTIVSEDKSLNGFIENGAEYLRPLKEFRDYLLEIRDDNSLRKLFDRNGNLKLVDVVLNDGIVKIPKKNHRAAAIIEEKDIITEELALNLISEGKINPLEEYVIIEKNSKYYRIGASGFNEEMRIYLLKKLLNAEQTLNESIEFELISKEEIIEIDLVWKAFGFRESAIKIFNDYHLDNMIAEKKVNFNYELLETIASENNFDIETLLQILNNTHANVTLTNRRSNIKYIEEKLETHKLLLIGKNDLK